jgi:thiol:disulfide interchange protein
MNRRLLAAALLALASPRAHAEGAIAWQPWSDAAFAKARQEHRFVILDLEAVWCHWCHVMDETTYRDPKVIALMGSRYVAVRVDQDSRPDLANRYEDYGWPATIVFAADGSEIVRRRGYLDPAEMASMLQAIIDDPSPGPSVTRDSGRGRPRRGASGGCRARRGEEARPFGIRPRGRGLER